ncbi:MULTISPECIES: NAD(P)/FAD-dependent oxidoreductase [unclassified Bradyrhizobium]|uniref:flavin-dependent monooxygenase QhpG n=1 Tax=unclassified Bradyrhizobium TaxID=2631580 RepID=UPI00247ACBF0|nr:MULTISPECIES: NAD(P)/FAD-dependent oxidoreductase [unclassified Bradyrhizobium]WGS19494.1 tryptophan 7-halogenase [Bradyrhizobium sp. ISRA463]WGS26332.1 tryptophan 7-halogenase [Bradyrhizobium sp. ISRA464]
MTSAEVCVIGGGPSGAAFAARLAGLGHEVILIERSAFPRSRVGEAMAPSVWTVLDLLGICDDVAQAGFVRVEKSVLRWAAEADEDVSPPPGRFGLIVDRGRFDAILLDAARRAGVRVLQPARAKAPRACPEGWRVPVETGEGSLLVSARFLVDAAGRYSNIRKTEPPAGPLTAALSGHWRDTPLVPGPNRVEAGRTCWYWGAPRSDGGFCAMVFVDGGQCRGRRRRDIEAEYRDRLSESLLLRDCLRGKLDGGVRLHEATPHQSAVCVTENSIKVGEASFSLDPLSSQGVQAAMNSGLQAAIVVHTMLTRPEDAGAAITFYRDARKDTVERHRAAAARHYAAVAGTTSAPFWHERAAIPQAPAWPMPLRSPRTFVGKMRLSRDVHIADVPIIERDRVTLRKGLHHPALERPFAYLDGVAVETLLECMAQSDSLEALGHQLGRDTSRERGRRMVSWLVERRILEASE